MEKLINTLDIEPGEFFLIDGEKLKYEFAGGRGNWSEYVTIYTAKNYPAIKVYRKAFYVEMETFAIRRGHMFLIERLQDVLKERLRDNQ